MGDKAAGNELIGGSGADSGGGFRPPRAVSRALAGVLVALVGIAVYLIAVRGEALFVDLAGISGMLFCF